MLLPAHHPGRETQVEPESIPGIEAGHLPAVGKEFDPKGKPPGQTLFTREDLILLAGYLHALIALAWYALAICFVVYAVDSVRLHEDSLEGDLAHKGGYDGYHLVDAMIACVMMVIPLALMTLNIMLVLGILRFRSWARWTAGVQSLVYAVISLMLPSIDPGSFGVEPHETIWTRLLAGVFGLIALLLLSPGSSHLFSIKYRPLILGNSPRDPDGLL